MNWQKSTYSGGGDGDHCIELATDATDAIAIRESDTPDEVITTTPDAFSGLIRHLKSA